jgi:hypothetical protein
MQYEPRPPYRIVGIRRNGSELELDSGYPSRGWCFASATKIAIGAAASGNPDDLDRLELRDADNTVPPAYKGRADLNVEEFDGI